MNLKALEALEAIPHSPADDSEIESYARGMVEGLARSATPNVIGSLLAHIRSMAHSNGASGPVLSEVERELAQARQTHAPMNGHHEGYAVMLEEMDELWEVCKSNTHSFLKSVPKWAIGTDINPNDKEALRRAKREAMRKEAIQIAAMAVRFVEDVCDKPST